MKIIHITASYKPAYIYGGPIQSVGKLCEAVIGVAFQGLGVRNGELESWKVGREYPLSTKVLTTTANGNKELIVETGKPTVIDGVSVTYFKRWTKDHSHFSPGLLWGLRKEIMESKNPPPAPCKGGHELIVHIHAWWNLVSVLSCFIAKWYGIPVVLSPRGMLTSYSFGNRNSLSKRIIHQLLGKKLLKYCHIHVTSEQEKADVLKIVKPKSIVVIPNLVNLQFAINTSQFPEDTSPFNLIFLSRIEEKKGLELLFEALAWFEIPWQLSIAGSGEENYIESLKIKANKLKLTDRIKWIGQLNDEDKFEVMAKHDLLVLPSYNENFANVIIESLSVGTPVLISEHVGLAKYVEESDLGWVCSLTPASVQHNLLKAFKGSEKRKSIKHSAPDTIRKDFHDDVLIKKYLEFYKSILDEKGE